MMGVWALGMCWCLNIKHLVVVCGYYVPPHPKFPAPQRIAGIPMGGPKGPLPWDPSGFQGFPLPWNPLPWDPFGLPRVPSHGIPSGPDLVPI